MFYGIFRREGNIWGQSWWFNIRKSFLWNLQCTNYDSNIIHYTTWHILKRNQWDGRRVNSITYDYKGAKGNQVEENGGSSCHCLSSTNWIATQFKRLCYYLYRHKWLCVWLPSSIYFALKYRSCQVLSFLYTKQNGFVTSHCHPRY